MLTEMVLTNFNFCCTGWPFSNRHCTKVFLWPTFLYLFPFSHYYAILESLMKFKIWVKTKIFSILINYDLQVYPVVIHNLFAYSFRRRGIFLLYVNIKNTTCCRERNFVAVEERSRCFSFFKRWGGWVNAFFKFLLISSNLPK